jgi:hypothetical protein
MGKTGGTARSLPDYTQPGEQKQTGLIRQKAKCKKQKAKMRVLETQ